ncbi:MAG: hypothetical protein GXP24_14550 [Planctomycetes bacterium]|nr:hypothetical protein [Planctomycetota bacterium]
MISGLVATLNTDVELAQSALQAIGLHPALESGPQKGCRLPLVLETRTPAESHDLTNWLGELLGVEHVDVVYVDLGDDSGSFEKLVSHLNK